MRARFAAYAKGRASFIMTTTDPRGPAFEADEQAWRASILSFSRRTRFTALEIIGTSAQDGLGWVRFRASLQQNGRDASFEERSTFRLEGADWLYVDGQIEPTRDSH